MPGRLAELHSDVRSMVATLDKRRFRLEKNPTSATGYINVIKVKGKFQARLQVPGDGRGGERKLRIRIAYIAYPYCVSVYCVLCIRIAYPYQVLYTQYHSCPLRITHLGYGCECVLRIAYLG